MSDSPSDDARPEAGAAQPNSAAPSVSDAASESSDGEQTHAGFIALVGAPNVGKSTLLNRILEQRLSISTPKPQTTRTRVIGIENRGHTQMIFVDTPGIHRARGPLHERMVGQARSSIQSADVTCWIVAADKGIGAVDRAEMSALSPASTLVVINKMDLVPHAALLPIMAEVGRLLPGCECIPVSARTGENLETFVERLAAMLPAGPWFYPPEVVTDQSERFLVAELVREQLFRQLDQELPYRVAVVVERYQETAKTVVVDATIVVDSASARRIIIGTGGARIKEVGIQARKASEELIGKRFHLGLMVKVRKDWQQDPRFLADLGL